MKRLAIAMAVAVASCVVLSFAVALNAQEPPKKITLALVGTAHIHTPAFVQMINARPDVRVKYVWDPDADRAKRYADELRAQVADGVEQIYADPEVSGVAIYAQTNRHRDLVLAAAKAHKHLFVEKPLGINAKESDEMAAAIEKAGVLFTTGYFNRCVPAHLFLKDQIAKGNLGKITRASASNCHNAALGGWLGGEWQWMTDPKIAGVGAFGDMGTHMLDILMWMFGDVQSATADIKTAVGRYGDTDECGEALFRFNSGVTGTLAAGWADVENPVTLEISGTEGHAVIFHGLLFFKSNKVPGADGQRPWTDLPAPLPHPVNLFVDAIGGKTGVPLVTPREAAARVHVMDAMYEGAKTQTWVAPRGMASAAQSAIIAPGAMLEKLADGFEFTEGPAADSQGNVFFTDQPNDRILKWSVDGKLSTFLQPCGRSNGLCFDGQGNLWACADEKNQLWCIDPSGKSTVVVKDYQGKLLNGPNDVWIRPDGGMYLTDPFYKRDYWRHNTKPQDKEAVYYLSPDHEKFFRVADDLKQPNGIIGTPDGKVLYVADIGADRTYSYDIQPDGTLANKQLFCKLGSDGMTIDDQGNVYLTGHGVTVFDRNGKQIEHIAIDEPWTGNVCFGGKDHRTLFITASKRLYALRMQVQGVGSQ